MAESAEIIPDEAALEENGYFAPVLLGATVL
jgi:hypothetical protein